MMDLTSWDSHVIYERLSQPMATPELPTGSEIPFLAKPCPILLSLIRQFWFLVYLLLPIAELLSITMRAMEKRWKMLSPPHMLGFLSLVSTMKAPLNILSNCTISAPVTKHFGLRRSDLFQHRLGALGVPRDYDMPKSCKHSVQKQNPWCCCCWKSG